MAVEVVAVAQKPYLKSVPYLMGARAAPGNGKSVWFYLTVTDLKSTGETRVGGLQAGDFDLFSPGGQRLRFGEVGEVDAQSGLYEFTAEPLVGSYWVKDRYVVVIHVKDAAAHVIGQTVAYVDIGDTST